MTTLPARLASVSSVRRTTKAVLLGGVAVAAVLAVASLWVPWLGIAGVFVASFAGIVAVWSAGREFLKYRAEMNAEAHDLALAHLAQLRQVRAEHSEVMDVLTARNDSLRGELRAAKAETGEVRAENSRLRGDIAALRVENTGLRAQVAEHEALVAELQGELAGEESVDIVTLPRRRAVDGGPERWEASEAETVIDLEMARTATPVVHEAIHRHAN